MLILSHYAETPARPTTHRYCNLFFGQPYRHFAGSAMRPSIIRHQDDIIPSFRLGSGGLEQHHAIQETGQKFSSKLGIIRNPQLRHVPVVNLLSTINQRTTLYRNPACVGCHAGMRLHLPHRHGKKYLDVITLLPPFF